MVRIETFVIIDLETTGLPHQESNRTKITEICLLAASREDIKNTAIGKLPPMSKLSFLLNPEKPITRDSARITGITNSRVKNCPTFREKIDTINTFLQACKKPVCLVAHNGDRFDYRILLAECIDAGVSLPHDVMCVDSLSIFRKITKMTPPEKSKDSIDKRASMNSQSMNSKDSIDKRASMNSQSMNSKNTIDKRASMNSQSMNSKDTIDKRASMNSQSMNSKDSIDKRASINSQISMNSTLLSDIMTDDEDEWPELNVTPEEFQEIDELCSSFDKKCQAKVSDRTTRLGMKLTDIFERYFGDISGINAHRAEEDCLMLLQCIVAAKIDFLKLTDSNSKLFSDCIPLQRK